MRKLLTLIWSNKLKVALSIFWFILFLTGLFSYAGSKLVFIVFSIVYLTMLLSGVYKQKGYGYLFLVIFFMVGLLVQAYCKPYAFRWAAFYFRRAYR